MSGGYVVKVLGIYSAIIGVLYIVYGAVELIYWIAGVTKISWLNMLLTKIPLSPSRDALAGFVLIVIGSILTYRIKLLVNMKYEGLSFLFVGLILSALTGVLYVLMIGADVLDSIVTGETWEYDPSAYNLPAIILFIMLAPCWLVLKYRSMFSG